MATRRVRLNSFPFREAEVALIVDLLGIKAGLMAVMCCLRVNVGW